MVNRVKNRIIFAVPALLAILAAAWVLGNLLLDVQMSGHNEDRKATPLPAPASATLRDVFETFPRKGGTSSRIELLKSNTEAWAARWRLLAEAREHLDVSYFILNQDVFGFSFLGHFLHKAREGVRIRILMDALGTRMSLDVTGNDYLDTLVGIKNVSLKMYRPLYFRFSDVFLTLNPIALAASDHDKSLIVNGRRCVRKRSALSPVGHPSSTNTALRGTGRGGRNGTATGGLSSPSGPSPTPLPSNGRPCLPGGRWSEDPRRQLPGTSRLLWK